MPITAKKKRKQPRIPVSLVHVHVRPEKRPEPELPKGVSQRYAERAIVHELVTAYVAANVKLYPELAVSPDMEVWGIDVPAFLPNHEGHALQLLTPAPVVCAITGTGTEAAKRQHVIEQLVNQLVPFPAAF